MTEATTQVVQLTRTIKAPVAKVFQAWTDPQQMTSWAAPEGFDIPLVEVDLRVGGSYRIRMINPEGKTYNVIGNYREVSRPHRLVYTWRWEEAEHDVGETLVTVEFRSRGDSTELSLAHELMPNDEARAGHEQGWTSCLSRFVQMF